MRKSAFFFAVFVIFLTAVVAQDSQIDPAEFGVVSSGEKVSTVETTVCCEKTNSGLYCQDVPEESCAPDSKKLPTSCESTSFCNPGYCVDPMEGICYDNTAQVVCNTINNGTWFEDKPAQCDLGCCILGDQASFVTLTRCKRLSSLYGLETNYNPEIKDEQTCIDTARVDEKGACVYIEDFEKTCKFTTRNDCTAEGIYGGVTSQAAKQRESSESSEFGGLLDAGEDEIETETTNEEETVNEEEETEESAPITGNQVAVGTGENRVVSSNLLEFHAGKLCSAEELGTNCGPTEETTCLPGREEVYFVDSCGNPANIYDSTKARDKDYWANIVDKAESCGSGSNEDSPNCGNCNYLLGSYCREATEIKPAYGEYICQSLNCIDDEGKERIHGESWCIFDKEVNFEAEQGRGISESALLQGVLSNLGFGSATGAGRDPVGSRFYRHICNNGKIVVEPCADFRQEECLENTLDTEIGPYTQAACRVNRWQDCTAQTNARDCMNSDRRDCVWLEGVENVIMGRVLEGTSLDAASLGAIKDKAKEVIKKEGGIPEGGCIPKNPPGLKFWEVVDTSAAGASGAAGGSTEAEGICAQANAICPVTYEKNIFGDEECVERCECLEPQLEMQRAMICAAMGDCGLNVNWAGKAGSGIGYKIRKEKVDDD